MFSRRVLHTLFAALWIAALGVAAPAATPKIGVAAAVKNNVQGIQGRTARTLSTGSAVFTNERIRTGADSLAQILFLDKTTLIIGAQAELTLDRFVYNPRGTGQVVLNAVQGAFRFVSGSQNPRSYTIKTPVGTLGIRGTVVEILVLRDTSTSPPTISVLVILVEGSLTMMISGRTYTLNRPGDYYTVSGDGTVNGPAQWNSTIVNAGVTLPMFGWYFFGELPENGPLDTNVDGIDQLNGIILRSLTPPPPPPPPGGGGCEGEFC